MRGYSRGLFGIIYGAMTWVMVIAFVVMAKPMLNSFLMSQPAFHDVAYNFLHPVCKSICASSVGDSTDDGNTGLLSRYIQSVVGTEEDIEKYDEMMSGEISDDELEDMVESEQKASEAATVEADVMCEDATAAIMSVIALGIAYILAKAIMLFLKMIIYGFTQKKEEELPSTVNLAGGVLGGIEGVLYMFVIISVCSQLWFSSAASTITGWVEENPFLTSLAEQNILEDIFFND